jgi:Na+/melibiose symporter-like transporter
MMASIGLVSLLVASMAMVLALFLEPQNAGLVFGYTVLIAVSLIASFTFFGVSSLMSRNVRRAQPFPQLSSEASEVYIQLLDLGN